MLQQEQREGKGEGYTAPLCTVLATHFYCNPKSVLKIKVFKNVNNMKEQQIMIIVIADTC
jgi:hypothetical protein